MEASCGCSSVCLEMDFMPTVVTTRELEFSTTPQSAFQLSSCTLSLTELTMLEGGLKSRDKV